MDIMSGQPFYIVVNNVSDREVHSRNQMTIANTAAFPTVILAVYSYNQNFFPIGTPEVDINPSDEFQLNRLSGTEHVSALQYKSTEDQELQMLRLTIIQDDGSKRLAQDWQNKAHTSQK